MKTGHLSLKIIKKTEIEPIELKQIILLEDEPMQNQSGKKHPLQVLSQKYLQKAKQFGHTWKELLNKKTRYDI